MNITGLTIQTTGHGSTNQNKIAGTATNLQFTITQVGATSIPDTLQNAVLLCGYPDIPNATYFMKVNFVDTKTTWSNTYETSCNKNISFQHCKIQ